jgi:hypothetical protein
MKRTVVFILLLVLFQAYSEAQEIKFDTTSISSELKKDSYSVVRDEDIEFEVSDIDRSKLHVHRSETVFSDKAKNVLFYSEETDKFTSLENLEIKVFNINGKLIKKYKLHDINAMTGVEEFIDDHKIYYLNINPGLFPVTVETEYDIKYKGTLIYPVYQILRSNQGVEQSHFTAKVKKDIGFRYKEKNIQLNPAVTEDGSYTVYRWSVTNQRPVRYEENAVGFESRYPSIILAPNRFELDNYPGDLTSWKNFGLWYNRLLVGTDSLSNQRKAFYRDLVKNARNDREKEQILYTYLQKNFRYVSIQLGIGGFRPLGSDLTDSKKYGDCKGLSNYLVTVLRCVNIKSYLALVNAESNQEPVETDFPCNRFNHVIVCIPGEKDSTWLECTSKTADFGVLGSFTENRNALLITDTGGVLVPTPKSHANENILKTFSIVDLQEDGSGKTNTVFIASGEYKQQMLEMKDEKADDQRLIMIKHWGFSDPGPLQFDADDQKRNYQLVLDQQLETIPEFKTGDKMFLHTSLSKLWSTSLPKVENRRQPYYFECPFIKMDTTVIKLPGGYKVDALPQTISDSCKYATYILKSWYDEISNQVYTTGKIVLFEHRIPAVDYNLIKGFFDTVLSGNEERLVIKKD